MGEVEAVEELTTRKPDDRLELLSLNCKSRPICLLVVEVSADDFRSLVQEALIIDIAIECSQRYVPRKAAQNCYAGRRR